MALIYSIRLYNSLKTNEENIKENLIIELKENINVVNSIESDQESLKNSLNFEFNRLRVLSLQQYLSIEKNSDIRERMNALFSELDNFNRAMEEIAILDLKLPGGSPQYYNSKEEDITLLVKHGKNIVMEIKQLINDLTN